MYGNLKKIISTEELQEAVDLWVADNDSALSSYGEINTWDVSLITDMNNLFQAKGTFNDDIGNWDVSNVTSMFQMIWASRAKSLRRFALHTEEYAVAIRWGNEVNTKGKHQSMQYERFPMLICEGNARPKCEGGPVKMTGKYEYPEGNPIQSVEGTLCTL